MLYGSRFESCQWLCSVYTNKKLYHPSSLSYVLSVAPTMVRSAVQPKTTRLCSSIRVIALWCTGSGPTGAIQKVKQVRNFFLLMRRFMFISIWDPYLLLYGSKSSHSQPFGPLHIQKLTHILNHSFPYWKSYHTIKSSIRPNSYFFTPFITTMPHPPSSTHGWKTRNEIHNMN